MDIDKSIIGLTGPAFAVEVEKGHIRQFAKAIGDTNPLYYDEECAAKTPYGGIIAPPTFPIALGSMGAELGAELPLKLDQRRMLHGNQEFIYHRPIRPGDKLYCQLKVTDLYELKGKSGNMQFIVIDTEARDGDGSLVVISRLTIIYRELKKK